MTSSSRDPSPARRACVFAVVLLAMTPCASGRAGAMEKPRVASINVCTDQLLLALAEPQQIVGLSPDSRDAARSWAATDAARYRRLSGKAEDVLMLRPDVVLAGTFTRRSTRELLKAKGLRVEEFEVASSLEDAKRQIRRTGEIVEQRARATAEVARLDAAIERARVAASGVRYRILPLARRGWVSGGETLLSSLLAASGLSNAAGMRQGGGFLSLEQIVALRPDLLLLSEQGSFAEDQGSAFLLHPALQRLYPPEKRLFVPERLTVCGGPMLAEALDVLTAEIERVSR